MTLLTVLKTEFTFDVFIDLSETFDTVNNDVLLKKLGPPTKEGVGGAGGMPPSLPPPSPTFSEIVLCWGCFAGNSLLCHSQRQPKLFWPGTPRISSGPLNAMA